MVERLRRSSEDQIIDMMRSIALRNGHHVVTVSLGDISPADPMAAQFRALMPEAFSSKLDHMLDAVEEFDDLESAEAAFAGVADAVALFAGTFGTGVQALLVRREGIVELALPNAGVHTIRSTPFPGFAEIEA